MSTWEQELQAAVGFLSDQIDDLRLLLRSTPDEVLAGPVGQSLMLQAINALSTGTGMVLAHQWFNQTKEKQ